MVFTLRGAQFSVRVQFAVFAILCSVPAAAEVVAVSATGFATRTVITVPGTPAAVYATVASVQDWWDKAHTYSGDSRNMSLAATPGGCFCEKLPGGGVQHGTVVMAMPAQALRVIGSLGPLQGMGVTGSLTWEFEQVPEGTKITQTYVVGGFPTMPFEKLAPLVDGVMSGQMKALKAYADSKEK